MSYNRCIMCTWVIPSSRLCRRNNVVPKILISGLLWFIRNTPGRINETNIYNTNKGKQGSNTSSSATYINYINMAIYVSLDVKYILSMWSKYTWNMWTFLTLCKYMFCVNINHVFEIFDYYMFIIIYDNPLKCVTYYCYAT